MHSKSLLLLIAVLALAAVACETDNPPQPIVEGPSLEADRGSPDVTVRPPASVTPRAVTPTNLAPAPAPAPRQPVIDRSTTVPRQRTVAPPPPVPAPAPVQQHVQAPEPRQSGSGGVGGVVNRVPSALP